jgi:hypothetical protein
MIDLQYQQSLPQLPTGTEKRVITEKTLMHIKTIKQQQIACSLLTIHKISLLTESTSTLCVGLPKIWTSESLSQQGLKYSV